MFVTKKEFKRLDELVDWIRKGCFKKNNDCPWTLSFEESANSRLDKLEKKIDAIYKFLKVKECDRPAKKFLIKDKKK